MRHTIVAAAAAALTASFAFAALPAAARTTTNDESASCTAANGQMTMNCPVSQRQGYQAEPGYNYVAPPTEPSGDPIPPLVGPTPQDGSTH